MSFHKFAKLIIKTLIYENIYIAQPYNNSVFKMERVHCSVVSFYVWLLLCILLYFDQLDLACVYLIFCGSDIFKYLSHESYHHDNLVCYLGLIFSFNLFYKISVCWINRWICIFCSRLVRLSIPGEICFIVYW